MADFDLSGFGDLANFSLGGTPTEGASFGGGLNFGNAPLDTSIPPSIDIPESGGGMFSDIAKTIYTPPEGKGQPAGGVLGGLGQVAGAISPLVQLGTAGMGIAGGVQAGRTAAANAATNRRAQRLQENVAGQQAAAAAPLTEFGKKTLDASTAGAVPPAVEQEIQQLLAGWRQKARDYAAHAGQGDSQMLTQWENWLEGQAETLRQKWREGQQTMGIKSLTAGSGALGGAGATAGNLQQGAQSEGAATAQLISEVNKALATLTAGASG